MNSLKQNTRKLADTVKRAAYDEVQEVSVPGGVVEHPKHGHNAIGVAIGAPDVAACRSDVVHGQPNTASTLGYACTLFQCVIDALQPACTACYNCGNSDSVAEVTIS